EKLKVHQYKILEWAELDGLFGMRASASIKSFLSCSCDNIRPLYGERSLKLPRRSVICGTTNKQEVLSDSSGTRRFWIVPVNPDKLPNGRVPFKLLEEERDLIWAAAVQAYKNGEKWWLEDESVKAHKKVIENHLHPLDYQEEIELFIIDTKSEKINKDEIEKYLNLSEFESKGFAKKLKQVMSRLGWVQGIEKVEGKSRRVYRPSTGSTLSTLSTDALHKSVTSSGQGLEPCSTLSTGNSNRSLLKDKKNKNFTSYFQSKGVIYESGVESVEPVENRSRQGLHLSVESVEPSVESVESVEPRTNGTKFSSPTVIDQQEELIENEDSGQNPDHQNTPNNVNGQEDFQVGDKVIDLESDEEFVIVEVIKNSPYSDGQYMIENERKLPEKIRGFALEKVD
ncbi:MAG: hypothetical protein F6K24_38405, partial [Okeania sp. SIO2D1]|nr:hypothetical protein [Okeania sp. SIO2D1]